MTRDEDAMGEEVEAVVPLMVRGVTKKENGWSGEIACGERWWRCWYSRKHEGGHKRGGGYAIQGKVGSGVAHRLRGEAVEEMGSGVQGLCPVAGRERRLKEKAAGHVGGGTNDAFGPIVLGRGVRARE
jgi:hypothetical protein